MALQLSVTAQALLNEISVKPNIILDIEGVDLIFGAMPILEVLNWDNESDNAYWDNPSLTWDGKIKNPSSRDYISFDGTTTTITQQIAPDKGNTSSITTVNIALIDKNGEISKAISFNSITEILGRKAVFSLGFQDGAYPEDASPIFRGVIVDFYVETGKVMLSLASSETLKRQSYLPQYQTTLTSQIEAADPVFDVVDASGFIPSQDSLSLYLIIDDEIIRVIQINGNTIGCIRGEFGTIPAIHEAGADVNSAYRIQGNPIEVALKIMLSGNNNEYFNSLDIPRSINYLTDEITIPNALIFDYYDIENKTGLTIGDFIKLDSTVNAGVFEIKEFLKFDTGFSAIVLDANLTLEGEYQGTMQYLSKWARLGSGLGMLTNEVNTKELEQLKDTYGANLVDVDFFIKDEIENCKDFIDKQIFFPQGVYSIVRNAATSAKFIAPPLTTEVIPTLNSDRITNLNKIKQRRSVHKYFYNSYIYKYEKDQVEDKYIKNKVIISANSIKRINVGRKVLKIEADGLRDTPETENMIANISQRYIDRYEFAPTYYSDITLKYKDGYKIEIGDVVPFGGKDTKQIDLTTGEIASQPKLYEVINKSINIKNGIIKLSLLETSFEAQARYVTISPSSLVNTGSTREKLVLKEINSLGEFERETDKWKDFAGNKITIRTKDYAFEEEVTLVGINNFDINAIDISPALSIDPTSEMIVEVALYNDESQDFESDFKIRFGYNVAQVKITSVIDNKNIVVDNGSKLQIGSKIYVHSVDYLRDSFNQSITIANIEDNNVELSQDLDFTPQVGDLVDGSNFKDGGYKYTII